MGIDRPDGREGADAVDASRAGDSGQGDRSARRWQEVAVGREEQVAAHVRYRETVAAAGKAEADRVAWAEAAPRLRAAWAEHQERYPERLRASPHIEADGSWVGGEYRRLDPEQNTEASKAHADLADEAERDILPAMLRVEGADPRRRLAGLEHMVKGEDRLKEKLADELFGKDVTLKAFWLTSTGSRQRASS
jgi:hypothetical protein